MPDQARFALPDAPFVKLPGERRDAAQRLRIEEAELLGVALDGVGPELERDLRERTVAGVCQRVLKRLTAVHARALDGHAADVNAARAGEAAVLMSLMFSIAAAEVMSL